jgi:membrane protein implicated in regulation of membrane protease activity
VYTLPNVKFVLVSDVVHHRTHRIVFTIFMVPTAAAAVMIAIVMLIMAVAITIVVFVRIVFFVRIVALSERQAKPQKQGEKQHGEFFVFHYHNSFSL